MKRIIVILLISSSVFIYSCKKSGLNSQEDVQAAIETLVKGIIDADRVMLESISADELTFGHSSGKVQNKDEFIEEIVSKKPFDYTSVNLADQTITISGDAAVVRHIYSADLCKQRHHSGILRSVMY